jgi:hypothetical protein
MLRKEDLVKADLLSEILLLASSILMLAFLLSLMLAVYMHTAL